MFLQRFLGSPWGKHFYLLKRRIVKGSFDVQENEFGEISVLSEMDLGNVDGREAQGFFFSKTLKNLIKSSYI